MLRNVFDKIIKGERLNEEERILFLNWADRAEVLSIPPAQNVTLIEQNITPLQSMVHQEIENLVKNKNWIKDLGEVTNKLGLQIAGEFRVGNGAVPGDGFTGGRFGYPGFDYGGDTYFLAGVSNDTLQVGLSLTDGKVYAGAGAVVLDSTGITATAGTIGGWSIGSTYIQDAAGAVGLSSAVTGGDDIRLWAGSANPVTAPFQVFESGALVATNATISGSITASSGTIGGWTISSSAISKLSAGIGINLNSTLPMIQVGNTSATHLVLDSTSIHSSNFVSGSTGFSITNLTGDAEFNNITARGELKTFLFTASNQMAVAGNIIVSKDAGKLGAAVSSGATTVDFGKALTVGDWIKIQGPDSNGSAALEWMLIGSLVSGTTYNVTRDVDGSGANAWLKDTPFVVIGASGDSRIELVAGASGYIALITQGATWNTQTVQASMSVTDGKVLFGGGDGWLDQYGLTFTNQEGQIQFLDTANGGTMAIYADGGNSIVLENSYGGGGVSFFIDNPSHVTQEILFQSDGIYIFDPSYINIADEVVIYGGVAGSSTEFNKSRLDSDFFVYGDNYTVFKVDAGFDRVEIGTADIILPTRSSSDPNIYFNEANQDMDTYIRTLNNDYTFLMDAGLDKATSFVWDGWGLAHETWTRTGNLTFTVSGDVTAKYRKGAKVRYKDGGSYEYGVIASATYSSPNTTVTLIDNTDYAMAAATITDRYISYISNPEGFPQWFNWNANPQGFSIAPSSPSYRWKTVGTTIFLSYSESNNGTSNATTFTASAPVAPQQNVTGVAGTLVNNGALLTAAGRVTLSSGSTTMTFRTDMSTGAWTNVNGKRAVMEIFYEF